MNTISQIMKFTANRNLKGIASDQSYLGFFLIHQEDVKFEELPGLSKSGNFTVIVYNSENKWTEYHADDFKPVL